MAAPARFDLIRDQGLGLRLAVPAGALVAVATALASLAAGTVVDRSLLLAPFVPALFLVTLWGGEGCGGSCAVFNMALIYGVLLQGPPTGRLGSMAMVALISLLTCWSASALRRTILALRLRELALTRSEREQSLLAREMQHRIKNLLAVVGSLHRLSARSADDLAGLRHQFEARLQALASAQDAILSKGWADIALATLVDQVLSPFRGAAGAGLTVEGGEPATVRSQTAMALSLVLHELATNAVKHGGLRTAQDRTVCRWRLTRPDEIELEWVEALAEPRADQPISEGFGSELLGRLSSQLGPSRTCLDAKGLAYCLRFAVVAPEAAPVVAVAVKACAPTRPRAPARRPVLQPAG